MAKIIALVDDIDHANGISTPADGTWRMTWDGSTVELDLTIKHRQQIDALVAHLFRIGTIVHEPRQARNPNRRGYLAGLRAWADALGRRGEYCTESGSYYYPKGLRAEYDAHLAG
jgi:hypothetical protein